MSEPFSRTSMVRCREQTRPSNKVSFATMILASSSPCCPPGGAQSEMRLNPPPQRRLMRNPHRRHPAQKSTPPTLDPERHLLRRKWQPHRCKLKYTLHPCLQRSCFFVEGNRVRTEEVEVTSSSC
eukprot:1934872-Pyramimonas_sp.AAC.1